LKARSGGTLFKKEEIWRRWEKSKDIFEDGTAPKTGGKSGLRNLRAHVVWEKTRLLGCDAWECCGNGTKKEKKQTKFENLSNSKSLEVGPREAT